MTMNMHEPTTAFFCVSQVGSRLFSPPLFFRVLLLHCMIGKRVRVADKAWAMG